MNNKKYQHLYHLTSEYARLYNYVYGFSDLDSYNGKVYTIDSFSKDKKTMITFLSKGSCENNILAEHISLIVNLLQEVGLDPIVKIHNQGLQNYLDYLNVNYEFDESLDKEVICNYEDASILGQTTIDSKLLMVNSELDIKEIIAKMHDLQEESLDAYLIAHSNEEKLKASILLNDLRLSGIVCDTCYLSLNKDEQINTFENARNLIILNDEDLQKGLITVRDNLTKEDTSVPEDEIIDYMLGVI